MVVRLEFDMGVEGFWSVPTSGFGHTADEQPLPFFEYKGVPLTPRYGADEEFQESNNDSIPLPYGTLASGWPLRQRFFNLSRRRINIYWRNFFRTRCRIDKRFLFIEQLTFKRIHSGFTGQSPMAQFERTFQKNKNTFLVKDTILFKKSVFFEEFCVTSFPDIKFSSHVGILSIKLKSDLNGALIRSKKIKSSTGTADIIERYYVKKVFNKNDVLNIFYEYRFFL